MGLNPGATFYDRWTDLFLAGFGPVLQAGMLGTPREDPETSVLALARRAGAVDGHKVLDAGCGVAGPAVILASHYPNLMVEGVTISARQAELARVRIVEAGLDARVRVVVADYQELPYPADTFDRVLFFESTGYATDLVMLYSETRRVLRPGGRVYVKDVFCRDGLLTDEEQVAMVRFDDLWGCVRSKTIAESVEAMSAVGLQVVRAGPIDGMGTARLAGSMLRLSGEGIALTDLGKAFFRSDLAPPILFGEILAS